LRVAPASSRSLLLRAIISLSQEQLAQLAAIGHREGVSRAELIRRAVAAFLRGKESVRQHDAFGLWADRDEDGLAYQLRQREEWPA
jgi:hypothetical protein